MSKDNKKVSAILSGKFETKNGTYIVEITSTDILHAETIHHKLADAVLIEYDDGSKYVVGADEKGHPVYMSNKVKKQISFEQKRLEEVDLEER